MGIIGPNGSGKTTLLKTLVGEGRPDAGRFVMGGNVRARYFSQDLADLNPENTVLEELLESVELTLKECCDLLGRFLLGSDALEKSVAVLSGGERCRLAMAKLFAERPNLLILDEPTNHLDIASREALEEALQAYPGTILFASHDRYFLDAVATRLLELKDGRTRLFDGGYTRYREARGEGREARENGKKVLPQKGTGKLSPLASRLSPGAKRSKDNPKKRLAQVEREIGAVETRLAEVTGVLSNPAGHAGVHLGDVSREYDTLSQRLQELYGEWESLAGDTG
jgi:ATP-binding cassette subfamily F protein 3